MAPDRIADVLIAGVGRELGAGRSLLGIGCRIEVESLWNEAAVLGALVQCWQL